MGEFEQNKQIKGAFSSSITSGEESYLYHIQNEENIYKLNTVRVVEIPKKGRKGKRRQVLYPLSAYFIIARATLKYLLINNVYSLSGTLKFSDNVHFAMLIL